MPETHTLLACAIVAAAAVHGGCGSKTGLERGSSEAPDGSAPARPLLAPALDVAVGNFHSCALLEDRTVYCWGYNRHGQLGLGDFEQRLTPTPIPGLEDVLEIAAGDDHTCARKDDGSVYCWGWNRDGQVGDGTGGSRSDHPDVTTADRLVPTRTLVRDVSALSLGFTHSCALHADGGVSCWGAPYFGAIGDGMASDGRVPVRVPLPEVVEELAGAQPCVLHRSGAVRCWGLNLGGGVGDGTEEDRPSPVLIGEASPATAIAGGGGHTCAIMHTGELRCWGRTPEIVMEPPIDRIAHGSLVCAFRPANEAWCWGSNLYGSLADGTASVAYVTPQRMPHWDEIDVVRLGGFHSCGIRRADRAVLCAGYNSAGALGDGTTTDRLVLTPVLAPP